MLDVIRLFHELGTVDELGIGPIRDALAEEYVKRGMPAYVDLQEAEFASESSGYTAARHQREVGTGYFDQVLMTVTEGKASTGALAESTEKDQFSATAH